MSRRAVSREWVDVQKRLAERVGRECDKVAFTAPIPGDLYHFTDCASLIGIFNDRELWASLATSLNDRSETQYGLEIARRLSDGDDRVPANTLPLDKLAEALLRQSWRIYVVSFCAHPDTALQWLHYGRAGSGAAIGFNAASLPKAPFRLFPVIYDRDKQRNWIRGVITKVDEALTDAFSEITGEPERELLLHIAVDLVATQLWAIAPRIKDPAFEAEDEWRLVAAVPKGEGVPILDDPAGKTWFRTSGGRVVPYKKVSYDPLPVTSITLGANSPMQQDLLALRVLMEDTTGVPLEPKISTVLVRA